MGGRSRIVSGVISGVSYSGSREGQSYTRWPGRGSRQVAVVFQHVLSCLAGVRRNGTHCRWIVISEQEGLGGSGTRMSPAALEVSELDIEGSCFAELIYQ
jgi:hypothetical protein